jgi:UDPglucose 6-dehydrogenase
MKYALHDFLNPDRIVVGTSSTFAETKLRRLYGIWKCPKFFTDATTAETIKYVSNAFFTTKVAFACEISNICKVLGVNAEEVMNVVSLDSRIGKSHLDPTLGKIPNNSACLPKDMSALIRFLEQKRYKSKFLKTVYETGVEK